MIFALFAEISSFFSHFLRLIEPAIPFTIDLEEKNRKEVGNGKQQQTVIYPQKKKGHQREQIKGLFTCECGKRDVFYSQTHS